MRRLKHVAPGEEIVPEHRCHEILRAAGLSAAAGSLATDPASAQEIAREIGMPIVLKGLTPAITHRAASGLVAADLRTEREVADGYARLQARAAEIPVVLDGIYVQKMVRGGLELLVSVFRDPLFGTMVSVGAGGGMTELLDDVATMRAPVDEAAAAAMIARLRLVRRTKQPPDARPAASFVAALSRLGASAPWPGFTFEVNPIKWRSDGVTAVDGLLLVEER